MDQQQFREDLYQLPPGPPISREVIREIAIRARLLVQAFLKGGLPGSPLKPRFFDRLCG